MLATVFGLAGLLLLRLRKEGHRTEDARSIHLTYKKSERSSRSTSDAPNPKIPEPQRLPDQVLP